MLCLYDKINTRKGGFIVNGELIYPKYRYVMGVIVVLCASLTLLAYMVTAPLLTYLAADFSVDMSAAGYSSTLHILFMGIFMFVGPVIIGWIDIKKTQLLGVGTIILGLILAWRAPSFGWLLAARAITGMGHGISGACTNSVVAAWFPSKEKSIIITINNLGIAAVPAFGYFIIPPLYHALGDSWRGVMLFVAAVMAVVWLSWIILGRDNHAMNAYIREQNAREGRKTSAFSGIGEALSRRDVWTLSLYMGLATVAANGISTYLPQFLQNARCYTDVSASATVGITTAVGAAGTFLGGIATTALGRRKPAIVPFIFATALFGFLGLISPAHGAIVTMLILYSLSTNFRSTASWTIATELEGVTPALASAASAMIYGVGFIGTLAVPALFSLGAGLRGDVGSMVIFVPLFLIAAVISCFLPETGPKKRKSS